MVPHFGQGAAQAIEDGFTLAVLLEGAKWEDVPRRLKVYEKLRIERTSRIQAVARDAGRFYRAEYENASERDQLMAKWISAAGWIRGHDAEQTAEEAFCSLVTTRRSNEAATSGIGTERTRHPSRTNCGLSNCP